MTKENKTNKTKEPEQTPKEEPIKQDNKQVKETLVQLVETNTDNGKYTTDIIASAFIRNHLLNQYEQDYEKEKQGLKIEPKLTQKEFEEIINTHLKKQI